MAKKSKKTTVPAKLTADDLMSIPKEEEFVIADRSIVEQYANCPEQADLTRKHGSGTDDILPVVGTFIHALADQAIKFGPTSDEIANYIEEALPKVRPDVQPHAIRAAKHLCTMFLKIPAERIIGAEMQVSAIFPDLRNKDGLRFKITTCIDLLVQGIGSTLHVYDYKTGYKKRGKQETFDNFQAWFIAYILFKTYPNIDGIHFWFFETRYGTTPYAYFDRNDNKAGEHNLPGLTLERQMEARIGEALKYWHGECKEAWPEPEKCLWCNHISKCKWADKELKQIAGDPKAAVDLFAVLSARTAELKKHLGSLHQASGPIQGTSSVFDWRPSTPKYTPKLYKLSGKAEESDE